MKSSRKKLLAKKIPLFETVINRIAGFTLVEILVAIAILASLVGGAAVTLNPGKQIDKARDAISQQGLVEIRTALDTYYQDRECYPRPESVFVTALNTGNEWIDNGVTYMNKAPLDGYGEAYIYLTSPDNPCPQWYALFSRLSAPPEGDACNLDEQSECVPAGFDDSWACTTAGITNCTLIGGTEVSGNLIVYPTATPVPSGTITPTPSGEQDFTIALPATSRPQFFTGRISDLNPEVDDEVTLTISTDGYTNSSAVTSVTAEITTDTKTQEYPMFLSAGDAQNGVWATTWRQNDTANGTFLISVTATNSVGQVSNFDIAIR